MLQVLSRRLELGLEQDLLPCSEDAQKVFVLKKGRLYQAPDGFRLAGPTQVVSMIFSPLFSFPGKIRMALEPFQPVKADDEDESISSNATGSISVFFAVGHRASLQPVYAVSCPTHAHQLINAGS